MEKPKKIDDELLAATALRRILGAIAIEKIDTGKANGVRDFDLIFADGRREALEVTSTKSARLNRKMETFLAKRKFDVSHLAHGWTVEIRPAVDEPVNLRYLEERLPQLLAEAEHSDVDKIVDCNHRHGDGDLASRLDSIGVQSIFKVPYEHHFPDVVRVRIGYGGAYSDHDLTEAVQPEICDKGNRRKLEESGHPARHLWVWVLNSAMGANAAIFSPDPKGLGPELHREVTHVWAAAYSTRDDDPSMPSVIVRSDGGAWKTVTFPAASTDRTEFHT